ncbi:MAG: bifunctional demethylmenaquinone methyltransferase/2-methoxy-6-polyprenyl-1,4-benzoquinol methylase UbiE [Acidobacteriota bacterium]
MTENPSSQGEIGHAKAVKEMFSGIAGRYDSLNHLLSLNIDKNWRRRVRQELADVLECPEAIVLDVACGTGDLSVELQENASATVVGTDFCRPMLSVAAAKSNGMARRIPLIEADGMNLPSASESFDAVTIAFGLRNFANWSNGLVELHRVLKPGGRLLILEFSAPVLPGFRQLFRFYFSYILPRIGGMVSGSRGAYEYLPDSVSRFPDQRGLAELMRKVGFSDVTYRNLTGGVAAIHVGVK